jgi:hypothetical protein
MISIKNAFNKLKVGGTLMIYDYADGDHRETKRIKRGEKYEETKFGKRFNR